MDLEEVSARTVAEGEEPLPAPDAGAQLPRLVIGWLRFVEAWNRQDIHAGLFETSVLSELLGFSFAGGDFRRSPAECELPSLAQALCRSCNASPILLVGLMKDLPFQTFRCLNFSVPLCCICKTSEEYKETAAVMLGTGTACRVLWANGPFGPQSVASEAPDHIMQLENPLEPFDRAAKGLAEAFADHRIQALKKIRRLRSVISLPSHNGNTGRKS